MTARDFVDWTEGLINIKNRKLVGDITHGYSYMDTDKAIEIHKRIYEQLRRENDVRSIGEACRRLMMNSFYGCTRAEKTMEIKNVIFNDPATIVFWADGSKTVVKCGDGDVFDPEKGLAMAISKRALGDKGRYYETFKKWLPKEVEVKEEKVSLSDLVPNCIKEEVAKKYAANEIAAAFGYSDGYVKATLEHYDKKKN